MQYEFTKSIGSDLVISTMLVNEWDDRSDVLFFDYIQSLWTVD